MNIILIIFLTLIPVIVGLFIIWYIFKNINKKYIQLFDKLILTANKNPEHLVSILNSDSNKNKSIIRILKKIEKVLRIDILKAGKNITRLHVFTIENSSSNLYFAEFIKTDSWKLTELYPVISDNKGK